MSFTTLAKNKDAATDFADKVYLVLSQIPKGKVATYGQVAALAGFTKRARQVGLILHQLPNDSQLPWHRVINSQGTISLHPDHPSFSIQCQRLQSEGIAVINGRVQLAEHQWLIR